MAFFRVISSLKNMRMCMRSKYTHHNLSDLIQEVSGMENILRKKGIKLPSSKITHNYKTLDEYHIHINDVLLNRKMELKILLDDYNYNKNMPLL